MLTNPAFESRPVTAIAYEAGFADLRSRRLNQKSRISQALIKFSAKSFNGPRGNVRHLLQGESGDKE
jgi:hypothetical protein